jgi:hypothetical protein
MGIIQRWRIKMSNVQKMISLSFELNEKLKQEENASGLIVSLLEQYYKTNVKSISEIESRQKAIEEERKKFQEKYSEDYATLENRKQLIKKEVESEEESKEKIRRLREEKIKNILDFFSIEMGREMTKEELSDYLYRLDNEKGFNFFTFIDEIREKKKNG